jgi:DNA ligase D-like protein (predicted 3'-phosphoesterase)
MGWVRNGGDGTVQVHAEGAAQSVEELLRFLHAGPSLAEVSVVESHAVALEGHEQFAVRGVSAGVFVIEMDLTSIARYYLRLEVDGVMRSWMLSKEPSLDPAVKRLAVELEDRPAVADTLAEVEVAADAASWDRGTYEQGGRVPWPLALDRGHAVFVLHGARLRGGFALQRTRSDARAQWLLIKRRDEHALGRAQG